MKRIALLLSLASAVALADVVPVPPPTTPPEPAVAAPADPAAEAPAEAAVAEPAPPAPAPTHPMGIEKVGLPPAAPSGVIDGGWGYVFGAYGLGYVGIALYALSLVLRRQKTGVTS